MGLDTRAFRRLTDEQRQAYVGRERTTFFGLATCMVEDVEQAPRFDQEGLDDLPWPGGLCGGMLSGNGDSSFRGKAYANYFEAVTGRSLYAAADEMLEGDALAECAAALRGAVDSPPAEIPDGYPGAYMPAPEERAALASWFELCVEHELVVGGDY